MNKTSFFIICLMATHFMCTSAEITVISEPLPTQPISYFLSLKGAYDHAKGNHERAATSYNYLKKIFITDAHLNRTQLKLAFDRGNYRDVIAAGATLSPDEPANKDFLVLLAQSYLFAGNKDQAIQLLEKLIAQHPHDDRLYYFLVIAQTNSGLPQPALETIQAVLSKPHFSQKHYLFLFLKAKIELTKNNPIAALHDLEVCLEQNPVFAQGLFLKASIEEKAKLFSQALTDYEQYLKISPRDRTVVPTIIELCLKTARHSRAQQLLETYPTNTLSSFEQRALLYLAKKEYDLARATLTEALEKYPATKSLQEKTITLLLAQGKFKEITPTILEWHKKSSYQNAHTAQLQALCQKLLPPSLTRSITEQLTNATPIAGPQLSDQSLPSALHICPTPAG